MASTQNYLPQSLNRLVEGVNNDTHIDSSRLAHIIRQADLKKEDFLSKSSFNHASNESYGRTRIYEGRNFSIYIMSWSPGDFTAIHSHGSSDWGAVYFFGDINHRLYHASGNKIELIEKGLVPEGTIAPVNGSLVHAMGNSAEKPVMTLHIYGWSHQGSNANDNSLIYELEKNQIRITDGSAFINIKNELCKSTKRGIITNTETVIDYFEIIYPFYKKNRITRMDEYIQKILKNPELFELHLTL
jgi:cysteine dioxygenase